MDSIDVNHIFTPADRDQGSLFQGSMPPAGDVVMRSGYDVLVLCALENQDSHEYDGVEVINAPSEDVRDWPIDPNDLEQWQRASLLVAQRIRSGHDVLVTCMAGLNRSGMVTALALHHLTGWDGEKCVWWIQKRRHAALFNPAFKRWLEETLKGREE